MSKELIRTGSVIAFPLLHELGYSFAKIIFIKDLLPNKFPVTEVCLWYVYNYKSETLPDLTFLNSMPWLCHPFIVFEVPPLRGREKCTVIGYDELSVKERTVPHFKFSTREMSFVKENYSEFDYWYLIEDFFPNTKKLISFEAVKHLPSWSHGSYSSARLKTTMEWIRKEGRNIDEYFDVSNMQLPYYHEWENIISTTKYEDVPEYLMWKAQNDHSRQSPD